MENGCGENCTGAAFGHALIKVLESSCTAGGDDGNLDGIGYTPRQIEVIATLCSVGIHTGEQNFSCTQIGDGLCPVDCIPLGPLTATMSVDVRIAVVFPARIDRNNDALAAEAFRRFLNETWILYRGSVQRDLIRAASQNFLNVGEVAKSAADSERNIDAVRNVANHFGDDVAPVGRCSDIEEHQF